MSGLGREKHVIFPFKPPQSVSTLTALLPFYDFTPNVGMILFALVNMDGTNRCHFLIEPSEDAEHPDEENSQIIVVPPGKQGSVEVGPHPLRTIWRLSAYTDNPAFPSILAKFQVAVRVGYTS